MRIRIGSVFTGVARPAVLASAWLIPIAGFAALFAVVSTDPTFDSADDAALLAGIYALCIGWIWSLWPRSRRWIEVGPTGLRAHTRTPNESDAQWDVTTFALDEIAGFETRVSRPSLSERVNNSMYPGTHLWVVFRVGEARPLVRLRRPPRVSLAVYQRGLRLRDRWTPVLSADGTPLRWHAGNADEFAALLWSRFADAVALRSIEDGGAIDLEAPLRPLLTPRPPACSPSFGTVDLGDEDAVGSMAGPWEQYRTAYVQSTSIASAHDAVTVSAAGVRPTLQSTDTVELNAIVGIAPRAWTVADRIGLSTTPHLSLELATGGWAMLPALQREVDIVRQPQQLLVRTSADPHWRPAVDADGHELLWGPANDARMVAFFRARVDALCRPAPLPRPSYRVVGFPAHPSEIFRPAAAGRGPGVSLFKAAAISTAEGRHVQMRSSALPQVARLASRPIETLPPMPSAPPEPYLFRDPPIETPRVLPPDETPSWGDLTVPARYWTVAEERSGRLLPRRAALRFTAVGVELPAFPRARLIPYGVCDAFAFRRDELAVWQLSLVLRDGSAVALPGLSHGWFKDNALLWDDGATRVPTPTGQLRWRDDDHSLVAARLNAQLALGLPASDDREAA